MKPRDIFKGVNSIKFYNRFRSDEDCYQYLSEIKWDGDSYVCKRCGNTHYCKGHLPYYLYQYKSFADTCLTDGQPPCTMHRVAINT